MCVRAQYYEYSYSIVVLSKQINRITLACVYVRNTMNILTALYVLFPFKIYLVVMIYH